MSLSARREYLARIHARYQRAGKEHKSKILDEFCAVCGYHRKSALRLLHRPLQARRRRPGPKPIYDPKVLRPILTRLWLATDQMCSLRLHAALPQWLPFVEAAPQVRQKLASISRAGIERILSPVRVRYARRARPTKPVTLLRQQVPLRGGPPDTSRPGHIEADTVAHGGDSSAGDFIYSLSFTDLYSGWTEIRAVWNKGAAGISEQLKHIEARVPFNLVSFHCDNGSEFLNWPLYQQLTGRKQPVRFTRSRPYRKNDNAHVEQKNWTHVRQLFGHERLEHPELVAPMNALYAQEWSLFQNHFCPSVKLLHKEKRGSRYRRRYEPPRTPYARLLQSRQVSAQHKERLRAEHERLNPFELKKRIEEKLRVFFTALGNLQPESTTP